MRIIEKSKAEATFEFSRDELTVIISAVIKTLNELDEDLHSRTGFDRPEADALLAEIQELREKMRAAQL